MKISSLPNLPQHKISTFTYSVHPLLPFSLLLRSNLSTLMSIASFYYSNVHKQSVEALILMLDFQMPSACFSRKIWMNKRKHRIIYHFRRSYYVDNHPAGPDILSIHYTATWKDTEEIESPLWSFAPRDESHSR